MIIICIITTAYNKLFCLKSGTLLQKRNIYVYIYNSFIKAKVTIPIYVSCLQICKHYFITSNMLLLKLQIIAISNFFIKILIFAFIFGFHLGVDIIFCLFISFWKRCFTIWHHRNTLLLFSTIYHVFRLILYLGTIFHLVNFS